MNDVFISYSRRDKVFTQKLYEALKAANRIVWADWDSIPAASDWDAEIKQGIQETNSVLFVLSPEWIKSNECHKELVHAVQMGKRLFPILYLPVDPNDVPPELAKINWVYMRDSDDFDKAFQTLCSAMDTDLDWIKTHTRIQVRALEWERKNRSASFALRGEDLTEGEQFIAGAANKSPVPTTLQSEYILASRKDATRRQRQTLAGVTVALVISIVLAVAAFIQRQAATSAKATAEFQRNNAVVARNTAIAAQSTAVSAKETAVANEKKAKRQEQIALARQLAAEANAILASPNGNVESAALLSIRALQLLPNEYVPSADAALNKSLNHLYTTKIFNHHNAGVSAVAYSPNGEQILVGHLDGTAFLYNLNTGDELQSFSGFDRYFDPDGGRILVGVHAVAFSPEDDSFLIAGSDGYIQIWDRNSNTMKEVDTQSSSDGDGGTDILWSAEFSPDGKYILIGKGWPHLGPGKIEIWNVKTGEFVFSFPQVQERYISHVKFSQNGTSVLSTSYDGSAILWDVNWHDYTVKQSQKLETNNRTPIRSGNLSTDGAKVLLGLDSGVVKLFKSDGSLIKNFIGHTGAITSVEFSPDGNYILTASMDNTARLWSIEGGNTVRTFSDHTDDVWSAVFSPDKKHIVTGSFDKTTRIWSADLGHDNQIIYGHNDQVSKVSFSPDGNLILSSSKDDTIRLWNVKKLEQEKLDTSTPLLDPIASFSTQGHWIAAGSGLWTNYGGTDLKLVLWEKIGSDYKQTKIIPQDYYIQTLAFSHQKDRDESQFLYLGRDNQERYLLHVGGDWNIANIFSIWWWNNDVAITQVAPDKNHYVAVAGTIEIQIYKIDDPSAPVAICSTPGGAYGTYGSTTIAFSNDGKLLASQVDNDILIWDWQTSLDGCAQVKRLSGHAAPVQDLTFSPDGKHLLSASTDGAAILWDTKTWNTVRILTGHDGEVTSAGFSPDGKSIVTGGADKTIRIWDTDYKDTIKHVCSLLNQINRDFTNEERAKYGITDNNPTCGK